MPRRSIWSRLDLPQSPQALVTPKLRSSTAGSIRAFGRGSTVTTLYSCPPQTSSPTQ
jgi:hypothetical protein